MTRLTAALFLILYLGSFSSAEETKTATTLAPHSFEEILHSRDALPETDIATSEWYVKNWNKGWGPHAVEFPSIKVPDKVDPVEWKRQWIITVAKHYIGLPYRHHHIPAWNPSPELDPEEAGPGLDCSNFVAWVYNYGLGIPFTSNIHEMARGTQAPGRILKDSEKKEPGDLLFILKQDRSEISHVVIFIDEDHIIDCHGAGVKVRDFQGWYRTHFSHARRVIE